METIFLELDPIIHNEDTYVWIDSLIEQYSTEVKSRGGNVKIVSERMSGYDNDNSVLEIREDNALNYFKEREGKHRIRVPYKDGRQQSLSLEISLYPEAPVEFEIKPKELSCEFIDTQLGRFQRVTCETDYAQLTHKPTKIVVTCGEEVGRIRNKEMAVRLLKAKLFKLSTDK